MVDLSMAMLNNQMVPKMKKKPNDLDPKCQVFHVGCSRCCWENVSKSNVKWTQGTLSLKTLGQMDQRCQIWIVWGSSQRRKRSVLYAKKPSTSDIF